MSTVQEIGELLEFGVWGEQLKEGLGYSAGRKNQMWKDFAKREGILEEGVKETEGHTKQGHLKISS